ncbi:MAG TPA: SPOR domain-containing protein [Burkholderiales bacterium]|nr:SPOR domain-containing protein [Burkholderiales bacterium]
MARTISDEQLQLKKRARRRLIGAISLVTLIVVVLPMLLDGEPKPVSQDINIQIPAQNGGSFASRVIPVPEKTGTAEAGVRPQQTETAAPPPPPAPKPGADKEPVKTAGREKPEKIATAENKSTAESKSGAYVVQFAAFAHKDNAKQLQQRLSASGIRSYTEVLKTAHGEKIRVRAGPYENRDAAEKVLDQLKALGLNGVVTPK